METIQKVQHNSAMGIIKKLKKIVRQCIANEWLDKDPFKSYKITTRDTQRNFLLKSELEILQSKNITIQSLKQVKDIFLFSCYTGLAYSDIMKLTKRDISIGIDREYWVFITRTKTDSGKNSIIASCTKYSGKIFSVSEFDEYRKTFTNY